MSERASHINRLRRILNEAAAAYDNALEFGTHDEILRCEARYVAAITAYSTWVLPS